ncbi:autotransporter outer membrane beta-barrel domain-containing protein [Pseudomonas typographi]|uniref:Autotransporter domain-containing protein n=1 Tax=Pseudomonas typographi TaxID=2715964 RepID=A0ABR7Z1Q3_9PSED|nr:autotransporter outer membrane beta-barrel domain-containing protein [Pseudomonas typographi]MBD1599327.1 autotransporter domain-containing protein [Pseudomonas typographi]
MDTSNPGQSMPSAAFPRVTPFAPHRLALAVMLAAGLLSAEGSRAATCASGTSTCNLGAGASVNIPASTQITVIDGPVLSIDGVLARRIVNSGQLTGSTAGIVISGGGLTGRLYNGAEGRIEGSGAAIAVSNATLAAGLANAGTLTGNSLIAIDHSTVQGDLANSANLSGFSDFGIGLVGSTLIGDLLNSGNLDGGGASLLLDSTRVQGSLRNSGVLSGGDTPLLLTNGTVVTGDVVNTGTVNGNSFFENATIEGRFINGNAGVLFAGLTALRLRNTVIAGGLVNNGLINSGEGVWIEGGQLGGLTNTGTIYLSSGQLSVEGTRIDGDIRNSGSILSSGSGAGGLGLYAGRVTGDVVNSGTLYGGNFGSALLVSNGERIDGDIDNSGQITGAIGIEFNGGVLQGSLINTGTVDGEDVQFNNNGIGVQVVDSRLGSSLDNRGSISGLTAGVRLQGSTLHGALLNSGDITSPGQALEITGSTLDARLQNDGYIGIGAAPDDPGLLDPASAVGIYDSSLRGLSNNGQVEGSAYGIDIQNSHLSGRLANSAGASVSGSVAAIRISASQVDGGVANAGTLAASGAESTGLLIEDSEVGSLRNSGRIEGADYGIAVHGSTVLGDVINSGELVGGVSPIWLDNSRIEGDVRNSADLTGESPLALTNGTVVTGDVVNTGTLSGNTFFENATIEGRFINSSTGVLFEGLTALRLRDSVIAGGLINNGLINSGEGVWIEGGSLGGLTNTGTIYVSSGQLSVEGTRIDGDIRNSGSILNSGSGAGGLGLYAGRVTGDVVNSGTLYGGNFGSALLVSNGERIDGDIDNSGQITGAVGIEFDNGVLQGSLVNTGTVRGEDIQFNNDGSGVRVNASEIDQGVDNRGLISGLIYGALFTGSTVGGSFDNRGQIVSAQQALALDSTTVAGDLRNSGYIGTDTGADPDTVDPNSSAIRLAGSTVDGQIVNSGTVSGQRVGLEIDNSTISGGLVNSGTLSGSEYSLFVDDDSALEALYIAGDNARFTGDVYAPNTTAYVYSNAHFTLADATTWQVEGLVNRGTLRLQAPLQAGGDAATLVGDYTQKTGAVLQVAVSDSERYGRLQVTGTASLPSDASIDVDVAQATQPFTADRLEYVLSAGTLVSDGTFAVTTNSALFDFNAQKVDNHVDLTLSAKTSTSASATVASIGLEQAAGVARVLDAQFAQGSSSALAPYFVAATSSAEVAHDLAQTLPSGNANLRASQAALGAISDALQARLVPASDPGIGLRQSLAPSYWSQPFNTLGSSKGSASGSSGQVMGFDTRISPSQRIGMAFAYARGDTAGDSVNPAQNSRLDLWQFTGYSAYTLAPDTELLVYAGAGHNRVDAQRDLALSGASGAAKAQYDSLFATFGASAGHAYALSPATRLTPSLRLDYSHIRDDGYKEDGGSDIAPLLLTVQARQTDQLIAGLDGRLEHTFSPGGAALRLNLGVGYDVINQDPALSASFAGAPGQRFSTRGSDPSPWLVRGGVGLVAPLSGDAQLTVNYSVQQRSDYTDQGASVAVNWAF